MAKQLGMWLAIIGGLIALIGQFWGSTFYLPLIGGVVAIIGGFVGMSK